MTATLPTIAPPEPRGELRMRALRCDDETWDDAAAQAKADGLDLSTVVRHYLRAYGAPQRTKSRKK